MSAIFSSPLTMEATNPADIKKFFDPRTEIPIIDEFISLRECPEKGVMPPSCDVNLTLGFFFDGTNNNLERDLTTHNHSNVARLYLAFPGSDKGVPWTDAKAKYRHYFRTYIPGVGTKFDAVGDTGKDKMKKDGLAFAKLGQNRIIWALVEAINHIHEYYLDGKLVSEAAFLKEYNSLDLPSFEEAEDGFSTAGERDIDKLGTAFTKTLRELHQKLSVYLPIGIGKAKDKGVVQHLYYSIFGFSRGAAKARVFANWFLWLCKLDASLHKKPGPTLGSIPVTFDFMGLFDTVASVGLASSAPLFGAHGHYGWADAEYSLKLPEILPTKCLHLVSSHEIRRSFPLDSIMVKNNSLAGCTEIVMPGVHSDVGGGYLPKEQGRGKDTEGADVLSRIPLSIMYRAARLAGVPIKLEEAPESVKQAFRVSPKLIETFNAYVNACPKPKTNTVAQLHEIMADQHQLYILWRKKMVGNMKSLQSVIDSDSCDREDVLAADKELADEIKLFEKWRDWKNNMTADDARQTPFSYNEWPTIEKYWDKPAPPSAITDLFDNYVHDSRAWFKPFGTDSVDLIFEMEKLADREDEINAWRTNPKGPEPKPLTKEEFEKVTRYRPSRNTADACRAAGFVSEGREGSFLHGGFLRYRKIYMGNNRFKPKGAVYVQVTPTGNPYPVAQTADETPVAHTA